MNAQYPMAHACMLPRRKTDYATDPTVRPLVYNSQLAEILVQRHEDALLMMGSCKNLVVSRILLPVTRPQDIVSGCRQLRYRTAPDTSIQ